MADAREAVESAASAEVVALVERIVRDAGLEDARERDALRRELMDHFEDAASDRDALLRFGDPERIADGLRLAHRTGRVARYAAKVLASVVSASGLAVVLQLLVSLRLARGSVGLTPTFVAAVQLSIVVVLAAVAAWELDMERLCVRLEREPVRLLSVYFAFFITVFIAHTLSGRYVTPAHVFFGSAAMIAVWASTIAILSRSEHLYLRSFGGAL